MEKQEIRYRVTMKAYHQAAIYGLIMRNRLLFRMGILAVLAVAGYVVFALRGMVEMSFLPVYIAVAYLIWMLVLLGREEQNIYRYAKSKDSLIGTEYILRFDAHTIAFEVCRTGGKISAAMKKLPAVVEMSGFYLFYVDTAECFLVPGSALRDEQRAALREALKEALGDRFVSRYHAKK